MKNLPQINFAFFQTPHLNLSSLKNFFSFEFKTLSHFNCVLFVAFLFAHISQEVIESIDFSSNNISKSIFLVSFPLLFPSLKSIDISNNSFDPKQVEFINKNNTLNLNYIFDSSSRPPSNTPSNTPSNPPSNPPAFQPQNTVFSHSENSPLSPVQTQNLTNSQNRDQPHPQIQVMEFPKEQTSPQLISKPLPGPYEINESAFPTNGFIKRFLDNSSHNLDFIADFYSPDAIFSISKDSSEICQKFDTYSRNLLQQDTNVVVGKYVICSALKILFGNQMNQRVVHLINAPISPILVSISLVSCLSFSNENYQLHRTFTVFSDSQICYILSDHLHLSKW